MILGEDATQKDAFAPVKELIDEALGLGLNISVFAYGSTGSGKTFTISGGPFKNNGLVQQAMAFI
jgi:kinesin family protein 6/9